MATRKRRHACWGRAGEVMATDFETRCSLYSITAKSCAPSARLVLGDRGSAFSVVATKRSFSAHRRELRAVAEPSSLLKNQSPNVSARFDRTGWRPTSRFLVKDNRLGVLHPDSPKGKSAKSGASRRHVGGARNRQVSRGLETCWAHAPTNHVCRPVCRVAPRQHATGSSALAERRTPVKDAV
jgi:hypothetical protein